MNPAYTALAEGFLALREQIGCVVTSDAGDSSITVTIEDRAEFADPVSIAEGKKPQYVTIRALASDIANPRTITKFTEDVSTKWHKVLSYDGSSNPSVYVFQCESQR